MLYDSNLIKNPNAEQNYDYWTAKAVGIQGVAGKRYFRFYDNGSLKQVHQHVNISIGSNKQEYFLELLFRYDGNFDFFNPAIRGFAVLTLKYSDLTKSQHSFPMLPLLHNKIQHQDAEWMKLEGHAVLKEDSLVTEVTLEIVAKDLSIPLYVDSISLRRSLNELEQHEKNIHPHQLPLSIGVGDFGIKATKGTDVKFWLKDSGDAFFAGELQAATGTFAGTVYAQNIDTSQAKIKTAQIEQLVVGGNVTMGPNAVISWGKVDGKPNDLVHQPDISSFINGGYVSDKLNNLLANSNLKTVLGDDYIITGRISANQIAAGSLSADRISGGTITGCAIKIDEYATIGNYLFLGPGSDSSKGVMFGTGSRTGALTQDSNGNMRLQAGLDLKMTGDDVNMDFDGSGIIQTQGRLHLVSNNGDAKLEGDGDVYILAGNDVSVTCDSFEVNGSAVLTPYYSGNYAHYDAGSSGVVVRKSSGSEYGTLKFWDYVKDYIDGEIDYVLSKLP